MKAKILAVLFLLMVLIIPIPAQADNGVTVYSGTGTLTNVEPVSVTFVSCDANSTFDNVTRSWAATFTGGGTAHLIMLVKNNAPVGPNILTGQVTVNAGITNTNSVVSAVWDFPSFTLAAQQSKTVTLTATIQATAPAGSYPIAFAFTR
jgi:hypothetical protein